MTAARQEILTLVTKYCNEPARSPEQLPQSGGDRTYYRAVCGDKTIIATYSTNVKENETFIYFTNHFRKAGAPCPEILAVNEARTAYLQEDLGSESLLEVALTNGFTAATKSLYKKALHALAFMQVKGDEGLDYTQCLAGESFDGPAILADLLYFKYYFLDTLGIPYNKALLNEDFNLLSKQLAGAGNRYFMFRDFQGRNVQVKNDDVFFIDYQGGMKGPMHYDLAAILWQAKAEIPASLKLELTDYYVSCAETATGKSFDKQQFYEEYNGFVLIRLLQVLGAYGFRGLFEKKTHFLASIPAALRNLREYLQHPESLLEFPELHRLLLLLTGEEIKQRFTPVRATQETPLTVRIKSFSFLKTGYPKAVSDNGGGFVFDCRGILNPGRVDEHKQQTGRDKPVQDYLTAKTRMDEFLAGVFNVVDISVEDYIKRDFEHLEVNFGCTGGQHRSVYAADALAWHLKNKFGVRTEVKHVEQNFSE